MGSEEVIDLLGEARDGFDRIFDHIEALVEALELIEDQAAQSLKIGLGHGPSL